MANKCKAKNVTINERINEFISKFDNEEADKLSQGEQIEIRDMLIELKNRRKREEEWQKMDDDVMRGLLPNGCRCKNCGSVNVELGCDTNGCYVKCEDCSHYVGGKNAEEALDNWEM